MLLTNQG